ncbi:MAG: cadmium-translocating P-type ATPase [Bacteroidales bacterium]|nr:cadmium-translocating P-type ATPase [Bacteroidales bacterium]
MNNHQYQHNHECSCEHHHEHHHDESKHKLILIVVTIFLLVTAKIIENNFSLETWQLLLVYLVPYFTVGYGTLKEAWEGITSGDIFNENFLMTIATTGALGIGFLPGAENEFVEAVAVMLFFQIGEMFEGYAEGKSRDSISHLMNLRPESADVERDGGVVCVSPEMVSPGEIIVVKPGAKIPIDGFVTEGSSSLNTVALTGESVPRDVSEGDEVISGCINISGLLKIRTTKTFGECAVSKIIKLVESADANKSKSESFITKFSRIYTPVVVITAIILAFLPPFFATETYGNALSVWLYRALIFLVVSCPCALVISVPLTFFGGIGGASRNGILVKGSNYMDTLANIGTIVFDKTGTLTHGQFAVESVHPNMISEKELLHLAAHVEHFTTHPVGAALRDAFPDEALDGCKISDVEEIPGRGIRADVEGKIVCAGNSKFMQQLGIECDSVSKSGTIIHVSIDNSYAGYIVISDKLKSDSADTISRLKKLGVNKTVMLTGDREEVAKEVAAKLNLDEYHAGLLPDAKVSQVERLLSEVSDGKKLAFVGDGINDAPVLKRADIGIAMGGLGSDAAIEAADIVIMDDKPSKIADAVLISRRTISIARQNVIFAIGVKILVLLLAALGVANMWMAVFADVGVTVVAVINAMRALRK